MTPPFDDSPATDAPDVPTRVLSPAAVRALAEAAERRRLAEIRAVTGESGGPEGPEPTRYGDWERKGLAVDF
jgi:hypothetical protein